MSSWWFRSAVAAMFFAAAAVRAQAPGDLDPTFGSGGKVTTDFGGSSDELFALAQQPDGMIVGAGSGSVDCVSTEPTTCSPPPAGFSLARYALDGSLDPAFGAGGLVLGAGEAHAVSVLGDGAILAAGTECDASVASGCELQVARYLSDGTLDATFGSGGVATDDFGGLYSQGLAMAVQSDGGIVVAGSAQSGSATEFALARFTAAGALDATFGTGGNVLTDVSSGLTATIFSLALQPDGKIVAAGTRATTTSPDSDDFAIARYAADGSLDASFGASGIVTTDFFAQGDQAYAVAVEASGAILAAGRAGFEMGFARYDASGALDATFGSGGKATAAVGDHAVASAIAPLSDGSFYAGGATCPSGLPCDFAVGRFDASGNLDASFGSGIVTTDFAAGHSDVANALLLQSDGKLVAGGYTEATGTTNARDWALARYLTAAETPPPVSNFTGIVQGGGWVAAAGEKLHFELAVSSAADSTAPPSGFVRAAITGPSGMAFASASISSVDVSGNVALIDGTGTIGGSGAYRFTVTVVDGGTDAGDGFRIQIRDASTDAIVFDSDPGAAGGATSAVSGEIQIRPRSATLLRRR